ncbi:C2f protein [Baffinella frigidus]|nr:C2f protein [Cryptophyta sp. CCMP2293]
MALHQKRNAQGSRTRALCRRQGWGCSGGVLTELGASEQVLERACLETVKAGKSYELLNCDDHAHIMKKHKRDPAESRPDISHQMLLTLLDSPLNKAGKLQVYIHTENNILVEVSPHIRIPRTYKRFAGLMVQLLHKLKIRATDGPDTLLKVIKNPVEAHLPTGARKISTSKTGKLVKVNDWVTTLPKGKPVVISLGALAHGKIDPPYAEECICVSEYPLSGSVAAGKICNAFENMWGIL